MIRYLSVQKAALAKADLIQLYRGQVDDDGLAGIVVEVPGPAIDIVNVQPPPAGAARRPLDKPGEKHYSDRER
jgi:hypothetical protein